MPESDERLVRRALAGDAAAFAELEARYRPAVERVASRLMDTAEDAEDMAQEALLHAWLRLGELRDPERFGGWLMAVARTTCLEQVRTQALHGALISGTTLVFEPLPPTPDEEAWRRELAREARELVADLPEPYRSTARRHYLDELTQAEVAREAGVAVGTVKARLHHARKMMEVSWVNREWYGQTQPPAAPGRPMAWEELARKTLAAYDLGELRGLGSTVEPSASMAVGIETDAGRWLWRYNQQMTPELVALQHAMLRHLEERGVAVKRLVPARDGRTCQQVEGRLVASGSPAATGESSVCRTCRRGWSRASRRALRSTSAGPAWGLPGPSPSCIMWSAPGWPEMLPPPGVTHPPPTHTEVTRDDHHREVAGPGRGPRFRQAWRVRELQARPGARQRRHRPHRHR